MARLDPPPRHPLYGALILLGWGVFLKGTGPVSVLLALAVTGFMIATATSEERHNLERLGAPYAEYMGRTRRFVPFLF